MGLSQKKGKIQDSKTDSDQLLLNDQVDGDKDNTSSLQTPISRTIRDEQQALRKILNSGSGFYSYFKIWP